MFASLFPTINSRELLGRDFDQLFGNYFSLSPAVRPRAFNQTASFAPAVNVWENENGFTLEAELPGISAEDLELTVSGNQLTLKGERKRAEQSTETAHRKEIAHGKFTRVLHFGCDLDSEKVQAVMKDGVLRLELPKAASAQPKKILIGTRH